jgi:xanthine dehydrogenase accessory factor
VTRGMAARVLELSAERVPFVHATVVRAQVPTSAHAGDDAIVFADGTIEGFVGGQCAETSVRSAALDALRTGETVLLRVLPDDAVYFPESAGAQVVLNSCQSGGALEIFLEPMLPAPLVAVIGGTPVADALIAIAEVLGYATARSSAGVVAEHAAAVVVASHGRDEHAALRSALDAGAGYIALVASRRRGAAVLDELGLSAVERARISTPAGLDIGARSAPEVALSILAEVITSVRSRAPDEVSQAAPSPAPVPVIDPVCGMTVTVMAETPHLVVDGVDVWFCGTGCRERHARSLGL